MASSIDFASPTAQFAYDLANAPYFKKNNENYINVLSASQLNSLGNTSLLDIYLSTDNMVEPHIHQNASELVYCIAGKATVSIINPFTNDLMNFTIGPGQVANVPQGWWHYEIALQDNTHLIAIFDAPVPEVIFGSDILRLTPASIWAHAYCLDEAKVKDTLAPLQSTVIIGPPAGCRKHEYVGTSNVAGEMNDDDMSGMTGQGSPAGTYDMSGQGGPAGTSGMTGQSMPGYPHQPITGVGTYSYPLRPIEPMYSLPEQPFYPIPYLYHSW